METCSTLKDIEKYISTLPQESKPYSRESQILHKYNGFWFYKDVLKGVILFQKNFKSQPNDILICSYLKSGFTWLKSLSITISTRTNFPDSDPNSSANRILYELSHDIVPSQEHLYSVGNETDMRKPLLSTHVPFASLPKSILNSDSKLIYVCRNPKDVVVSLYHFSCDKRLITIEEAYEKFCNGVSTYGSYWDHVLEYWKASLEFPDRVLFLKYKVMKNDSRGLYVKKIADFIGCPFSVDEEKQGIPEKDCSGV